MAWAPALIDTAGVRALVLIVAGGLAYTAGLAFYLRSDFRYGNVY